MSAPRGTYLPRTQPDESDTLFYGVRPTNFRLYMKQCQDLGPTGSRSTIVQPQTTLEGNTGKNDIQGTGKEVCLSSLPHSGVRTEGHFCDENTLILG